jgi:hypothetical protein
MVLVIVVVVAQRPALTCARTTRENQWKEKWSQGEPEVATTENPYCLTEEVQPLDKKGEKKQGDQGKDHTGSEEDYINMRSTRKILSSLVTTDLFWYQSVPSYRLARNENRIVVSVCLHIALAKKSTSKKLWFCHK